MTNNLHTSECFIVLDTEGLDALPNLIEITDKDGDLWTRIWTSRGPVFTHPHYGKVTSAFLGGEEQLSPPDGYAPFVIENPSLLGEFCPTEYVTVEDMAGLRALPVGAILGSPEGGGPFRKTAERYEWFVEDQSWGAHGLNDGRASGNGGYGYLPAILTNPEILGEFYPPHGVEVGQAVRLVGDVECYGLRAGEILTIQQVRKPVVGTDFGIDFANDTTDGVLERGFLARFEFEVVEEPLADWELELLNGFDALIYHKGDRVMIDYKAQSESARKMWSGPATVTHDYAGTGWVRVQPDGYSYPGSFALEDVSPLVETEETDTEPLVCGFSYDELAVLTQAFKLLAKASGVPIVVAWPVADLAA